MMTIFGRREAAWAVPSARAKSTVDRSQRNEVFIGRRIATCLPPQPEVVSAKRWCDFSLALGELSVELDEAYARIHFALHSRRGIREPVSVAGGRCRNQRHCTAPN